jgi:hypothetical protein
MGSRFDFGSSVAGVGWRRLPMWRLYGNSGLGFLMEAPTSNFTSNVKDSGLGPPLPELLAADC